MSVHHCLEAGWYFVVCREIYISQCTFCYPHRFGSTSVTLRGCRFCGRFVTSRMLPLGFRGRFCLLLSACCSGPDRDWHNPVRVCG